MSVEADVCVIGAGPAGLTAAYCLTKEMPSVLVIEKDPVYVGGISRTVTYKDFSFDIGGHRFFSKAKEVVELWHEILPDDFIERPRLSRIYYNGRFYAYPLKAFEALTNLGLVESAACMLSYCLAKAFPIREPRSFHDWVRNQFGERLFQIFFKTYTEKVWGMSCDEISADWAAQRIKGLDLRVAVMNALTRSLRGKRAPSGGPVQNFRSWSPELVPDGMSCLGLEYFCFEGDGLWTARDADLIALAKAEVAKIGLVSLDDVVGGCVVRQPKAYPVYDDGYRDNVAMIRRDLEHSYPTLHLVGRNGMHKYNNQDHAMMTAMLTARNILAGTRLYDVWAVNEDAEYHEAGASGAKDALASDRFVPAKADVMGPNLET